MPHTIQNRPFELIAGHPALDFVNTLDWRFRDNGPEELLSSYDDLLRFASQSGLLNAKQIRSIVRNSSESQAADALVSCRELREAAAEIFYAAVDDRTPAASQIKIIERCFKEARERQRLAWSGTRLVWEWPSSECGADLPVWMLAVSAGRVMLSDDMRRI